MKAQLQTRPPISITSALSKVCGVQKEEKTGGERQEGKRGGGRERKRERKKKRKRERATIFHSRMKAGDRREDWASNGTQLSYLILIRSPSLVDGRAPWGCLFAADLSGAFTVYSVGTNGGNREKGREKERVTD
jgi:hypothetical protein